MIVRVFYPAHTVLFLVMLAGVGPTPKKQKNDYSRWQKKKAQEGVDDTDAIPDATA